MEYKKEAGRRGRGPDWLPALKNAKCNAYASHIHSICADSVVLMRDSMSACTRSSQTHCPTTAPPGCKKLRECWQGTWDQHICRSHAAQVSTGNHVFDTMHMTMHIGMYVYTYAYTYARIYVYITYVYIWICIHIYSYICIFMFK